MNAQQSSTIDDETEAKNLRRHFKFTNDDLEENRRGVLSKKQMKRIACYERGGKIAFSIIGMFLLVFSVGFANTTIPDISRAYQDELLFKSSVWIWGVELAFLLLLGIFFFAIGVAGVFLIVSQLLRIKPYKLASVRGLARLEKGHGDRYRHIYYDLHIKNQQFDGDSTLNKVIIQGAEYIVYYLESNSEIMSIEKISDRMSVISE